MTTEELKVIISAEIGDLKKDLQEATQEIKGFSKDGESAISKFGKGVGAAGKAVGTAMKAVGTAFVAGATALVGLSASTEEYRVAQSKLTTAFEAAGASAETATATYDGLYRVLGDTDVAVEAANHLAQLTTNEQELTEWTQICQGVYATFGDSLPIESLTEAANETAKTGQLTGALADALNWAGVSEEDFQAKLEACNSEAEREALIRETLTGIYEESAAAYEKNAADILAANEAQSRLNESMAALGAAVTPIVTVMKGFGADLLEAVVPGLEKAAEGIKGIIAGTDGAAEQFAEGISEIFDGLLSKLTEMLPMALQMGLQIITSLIEGILNALPSLIDTVVQIVPQIVNALLDLLPQLLEVGIQLISSILEGVAKMLPELLTKVAEIVPVLVKTLVEGIPTLLDGAVKLLMAIVDAIPKFLPQLIRALPDIIKAIIETLLDAVPQIIDAAVQLLMGIVDAIPEIIDALVEAIPEIIIAIVTTLIEGIPQIIEAAFNLLMGVVEAIPKILTELYTAVPKIYIGIAKKLEEGKGTIKSSAIKAFDSIKEVMVDLPGKLKGAITNIINYIKTNLIEKLKGLMKFEWSLPKLKLPKISISGKFSLNPPEVPRFSISWNKLGGIFDKPTIFGYGGSLQGIGEDGAEAVVPLEKNTKWMNVLADKLAARMGQNGTPIILQVDGKTFAETSISSINQLTRQTGKLSLNIV